LFVVAKCGTAVAVAGVVVAAAATFEWFLEPFEFAVGRALAVVPAELESVDVERAAAARAVDVEAAVAAEAPARN